MTSTFNQLGAMMQPTYEQINEVWKRANGTYLDRNEFGAMVVDFAIALLSASKPAEAVENCNEREALSKADMIELYHIAREKPKGEWMHIVRAMLAASAAAPAQSGESVAWRELCRRLYVELFHCDQQMRCTRDEEGEPHWTQSTVVRDVLTDAKTALEAAPQSTQPAKAGEACAHDYVRSDSVCTECGEQSAVVLDGEPAGLDVDAWAEGAKFALRAIAEHDLCFLTDALMLSAVNLATNACVEEKERLVSARAASPQAAATQAVQPADTTKMIADIEAEQTFLGSSRNTCSESDKPRWDRLQAIADHLSGGA
jgi:hypothetical protein